MPTITTKDGTEIFYKDWGSGPPSVFSHGWPLSADDWDDEYLFCSSSSAATVSSPTTAGGHGRSTQTSDGHDMDHYADDLAALIQALDLRDAIHIGHSTGGGEVTRYLARHGDERVSKAALISAVPPLMVKTPANPTGLPEGGLRRPAGATRRPPFPVLSRPSLWPLLRLQPTGREVLRGHHPELVAPGHDGRRQSPLRRCRRLLQRITDFTEDLKQINVPILVMHSEDEPDCPRRRRRPAVRQASKTRHPENL